MKNIFFTQIKKMMNEISTVPSLDKILGTRVSGTGPKTHVIHDSGRSSENGSYYLSSFNRDQFYKEYNARRTEGTPTVSEIQATYAPIVIDVDLKVKRSEVESKLLYSEEDVNGLVKICQDIYTEAYPGVKQHELDCIKLSKRPYEDDKGNWKHGFHLQVPALRVEREKYTLSVHPKIVDRLCKSSLFPLFPDKKSILDPNAQSVPWLMYASAKTYQKEPYLFDCVISTDGKRHGMDRLKKTLGINRPITENDLPRLLSVGTPYVEKTFELNPQFNVEKPRKTRKSKSSDSTPDPAKTEKNQEYARQLLSLFPEELSVNRGSWFAVGCAIHRIFNGNDEGFELWDEFSQRSPEYKGTDDIKTTWNSMDDRDGFDIGTLQKFARENHPEEAEKLKAVFRPSKKQMLTRPQTSFSRDEPYYFADFVKDFKDKVFGSKEAMVKAVCDKIGKVLARITKGNGFYIKKNSDQTPFDECKILPKFTMAYMEADKFVKVKSEDIYADYIPTYNELAFRPSGVCDPKYLNTWPGFKAKMTETSDREILDTFLYHLKTVWCDNDEVLYDYVIRWFASMLHEPENHQGPCLFVSGGQGSGKNCLTDFFKEFVVGVETSTQGDIKSFIGKFNKRIQGKMLIIGDEMSPSSKEFFATYERLKEVATNRRPAIEPKGLESYEIDNFARIILISNYEMVLPLKADDRRFCCLRTSSVHIGDVEYFTKFRKTMMNQHAGNVVFTYLSNISVGNLSRPPKTALKDDIIEGTAHSSVRFVKELQSGELELTSTAIEHGTHGKIYRVQDIYREYVQWCVKNGEYGFNGNTVSKNVFSRHLNSEMNIKSFQVKINKENFRYYKAKKLGL